MNTQNVALIIPGGLGTGKNNLGVPVLEQIVKLLSKEINITVFQLYEVNSDYKVDGFELTGFKAGNRVIQYTKFIYSFYKANKKKKFAAVHGFWVWPCGFLAVLLGKTFRIKSIVSVLGGDAASIPEIEYGHLRSGFSKAMILWSLKKADEANALTHFLAENLYQAGLKRKLKIIPWGVDQNLFHFKEKPFQSPIQFLHIANLNKIKDQETLLRSFQIISSSVSSYLIIIGEGSEKENIKRLINELQLDAVVSVQEQIPYERLPSVYHQSDILLHTSLAEGQSEVVTEAMSCGTIVCGTKVGLLNDLPGCCISVPVRDYKNLAEKVIDLIKDDNQINKLRTNAQRWCNTHSIGWTASQIIESYRANEN